MHVYTAVIVRGPRTTAYGRASRLLGRAAPRYFDHHGVGATFEGRLVALGLVPADDPWTEAVSVSRLPSPVPEGLVPGALVTPRAAWIWSPLEDGHEDRWASRVNALIDRHRGGHTLVVCDAHC